MSYLTANIPPFQTYVRNEFLYDQQSDHGEFTEAWVCAVRAVKGHAFTFYALLENGALYGGLPISAFTSEKTAEKLDLGIHQLWDCLSYNISPIEIQFVKGMKCEVFCKDKQTRIGEYIFSIDFSNSNPNEIPTGVSETPHEWKISHFVHLDDGNYVIYPPNRIVFKDASLVSPDSNPATLGYKVNTTLWSCENGKKWSAGDDENWSYTDKNER